MVYIIKCSMQTNSFCVFINEQIKLMGRDKVYERYESMYNHVECLMEKETDGSERSKLSDVIDLITRIKQSL